VNAIAPQIPFELFQPESPSFENFLVGRNEEAVTQLYASASSKQSTSIGLWSGAGCGKTHLLNSIATLLVAQEVRAVVVSATTEVSISPFEDVAAIIADDVHRFDAEKQAWLFNAFNHVIARSGLVVVAGGATPPAQWPIREDLRTRLASGLVFELLPPPDDALPTLLRDFASKRGVSISDEALTYLLTHTNRDVGTLCQTLAALDRLSLSLKRPIAVPLIRTFLAQRPH
jgi:DnaA-homolog protein